MLVTLAGIVMEVKAIASWNIVSSMMANWDPASNVTELKLDASRNASSPILTTLAGIVMEVKLITELNAPIPMLITPAGIVMEVKLDALLNALFPMLVN